MVVKIDLDRCTGCGTCVDVCPMNCFELAEVEGRTVSRWVRGEECVLCRACEVQCPNEAITVVEEEVE